MVELARFVVLFFLDLRRLSAALSLILAYGLTNIWISVESIGGFENSDRLVIGGIVATLLVISASLLISSVRYPEQAAPSTRPDQLD